MTLAKDVAAAVDAERRRRVVGVSEVVNELVRAGLARRSATAPFRQLTSPMGVPRMPVDDVAGLLEALEGDDHRS